MKALSKPFKYVYAERPHCDYENLITTTSRGMLVRAHRRVTAQLMTYRMSFANPSANKMTAMAL